MSTNEETLSCPHCKSIVTTSKTLGFGPDKVVTCGKCGKKYTLGEARQISLPTFPQSESMDWIESIPPVAPPPVPNREADTSPQDQGYPSSSPLAPTLRRSTVRLRNYWMLEIVIFLNYIAAWLIIVLPILFVIIATSVSQVRNEDPIPGLLLSLPFLPLVILSVPFFLSAELSRLTINVANDVQIIAQTE